MREPEGGWLDSSASMLLVVRARLGQIEVANPYGSDFVSKNRVPSQNDLCQGSACPASTSARACGAQHCHMAVAEVAGGGVEQLPQAVTAEPEHA